MLKRNYGKEFDKILNASLSTMKESVDFEVTGVEIIYVRQIDDSNANSINGMPQ